MNLLVTGGAGFIGSNFVEHVIGMGHECKMVVYDNLTYAGSMENLAGLSVGFEKGDICDAGRVRYVMQKHDITHIIHFAAESHVDRSIDDPSPFIETNVYGTFTLLESCRRLWHGSNRSHRFHHVSTDEVYGSLSLEPGEKPFTESTPYAPNSPYSASKAASDMLVRSYNKTYGIDTVITNCSNNYGPRQHAEKLIPKVIHNALHRQPIPVYGDGLNVRDWLHVSDHCDALWQVLTRGRSGETYNIGGHAELSNKDIVSLTCEIVDGLCNGPTCNSKALIHYVKDRQGHDRRYAVDCAKIKRELGWVPSHTIHGGLHKTVEWYMR